MADQLKALVLGCYANPMVKSPNIDRLAGQGVTFVSAYGSNPLRTPARCAFMTGQNISQCGGYDNAAYWLWTMSTDVHHLRSCAHQRRQTTLSGNQFDLCPYK
jgi:choline-sulfatase